MSVAFKREIRARVLHKRLTPPKTHLEGCPTLSSIYWIATLPSTLPIAKPLLLGKHATTRVCHLSGEVIVWAEQSGSSLA
jgi:hypothetical protein